LAQRRVADPVLSTLAQGYANPDLIGAELLPIVAHPKEGGFIPAFGKEAFQAYNTRRAPRGSFARVDLGMADPIPFQMAEDGVEVPVDLREGEEAAGVLDMEMAATAQASYILMRSHERAVAALASNGANYAGNTAALAGNDRWDVYAHADSNPFADVENAKEAVRSKVGRYPNVLVLGAKVYAALKSHPVVVDRIKHTSAAVVTAQMLAGLFDVERVLVGRDVTASAAGAFSDVWGKVALLAVVAPAGSRSLGTPAFGYTLRKTSYPTVRRYFDEQTNSNVVQAQDILVPKILSPGAGYLYTTVIS
jgi:hypothetical protein